jgi:succinate dehydrogenase / fumarate reductase, cytochrome b subunit
MGWFTSSLTSSIGKKLIMSLAGLFLILFLVVHLGINLTLLRNDGGEWFSAGSGFMSTNYVIKCLEIFLFIAFILHMIYGVIIQIQNWMSRPKRYKIVHYSQTSFFSKFMIHTAVVIAVFLVIHLMDFYFVKLNLTAPPEGVTNKHDFYGMAMSLFHNPIYCIIYVSAMLFLSFHLIHAFQSAFQTLGLDHNKYTPFIKSIGIIYSIGIGLGFALIPVLIYFFY